MVHARAVSSQSHVEPEVNLPRLKEHRTSTFIHRRGHQEFCWQSPRFLVGRSRREVAPAYQERLECMAASSGCSETGHLALPGYEHTQRARVSARSPPPRGAVARSPIGGGSRLQPPLHDDGDARVHRRSILSEACQNVRQRPTHGLSETCPEHSGPRSRTRRTRHRSGWSKLCCHRRWVSATISHALSSKSSPHAVSNSQRHPSGGY